MAPVALPMASLRTHTVVAFSLCCERSEPTASVCLSVRLFAGSDAWTSKSSPRRALMVVRAAKHHKRHTTTTGEHICVFRSFTGQWLWSKVYARRRRQRNEKFCAVRASVTRVLEANTREQAREPERESQTLGERASFERLAKERRAGGSRLSAL